MVQLKKQEHFKEVVFQKIALPAGKIPWNSPTLLLVRYSLLILFIYFLELEAKLNVETRKLNENRYKSQFIWASLLHQMKHVLEWSFFMLKMNAFRNSIRFKPLWSIQLLKIHWMNLCISRKLISRLTSKWHFSRNISRHWSKWKKKKKMNIINIFNRMQENTFYLRCW